jgi:hypothetical protein
LSRITIQIVALHLATALLLAGGPANAEAPTHQLTPEKECDFNVAFVEMWFLHANLGIEMPPMLASVRCIFAASLIAKMKIGSSSAAVEPSK